MKAIKHLPTTIRFRKWSRKAYAAFASIGKCVTIGHVSKSIADNSLSKRKTAILQFASVQKQSVDVSDLTSSHTWEQAEWDLGGIIMQTILHSTPTEHRMTIDHSRKYISTKCIQAYTAGLYNTRKYMPVLFKNNLLL